MYSHLLTYCSEEQRQSLYNPAFNEICGAIYSFIDKSKSEQKVHSVCAAYPGHGKTTALECIMKSEILNRSQSPYMLVFLNNDNMKSFYDSIFQSINGKGIVNAITYVDADNVEEVLDDLPHHRIICITQQRLRDIALHLTDDTPYKWFRPNKGNSIARTIIIDECPVFMSGCTFDLCSTNNHIDWFDCIADRNVVDATDKRFAREIITRMLNEALHDEATIVQPLVNRMKEEERQRLQTILDKLTNYDVDSEHILKFNWFKRLLHEKEVGVVDQNRRGSSILCARRIDYRFLGNILILDGTSHVTRLLYNDEYKLVELTNFHKYEERLFFELRVINTTSYAKRTKEDMERLYHDIAFDLKYNIRESGETVFPLMKKSEIGICEKHKIITADQMEHFDSSGDGNELALNLFNTTGKNVLNQYESLALMSIPIKNPDVYKKMAISLFGVEINLQMNTGNAGQWFVDDRVNQLYEELLLADLIQIIHRCRIRNINDSSEVCIYFYTRQRGVVEKLMRQLKLSLNHLVIYKVVDYQLHNFTEKCKSWADVAKEYISTHKSDNPFEETKKYPPSEIGNRSFKDWLNRNWGGRASEINSIFAKRGLAITVSEKGYKSISNLD